MTAATFAAVAIARPLGPPSGDDEKTAAMDVIVALDISDSMGVTDVKANRLAVAKEFVKKLVLAAPNNRYGLVLFSGDTVITCPATLDHDAFLTFVDDADFQRANLPGTAIGEAILTAATRFKKDELPRVVLVVTDGENTYGADPVKAAETAKQAGLKVYAAGVGTVEGGRIPGAYDFYGNVQYKKDKQGNIVVSKLDEDSLNKITDAGGGRYFAASDGSSVKSLAKEFTSKSKKVIKDPFQGAKEYGPWVAFAATVLVAIAMII
jgi:Ca-activated chloride channel family protein